MINHKEAGHLVVAAGTPANILFITLKNFIKWKTISAEKFYKEVGRIVYCMEAIPSLKST